MSMQMCVIIIAIIVLLLLVENYRETHRFIIRHYQIVSPKLHRRKKAKTVVLLSDLHNQIYGNKNDKLIDAVRQVNPDVILIAGDMIIGNTQHSFDTTVECISQLAKIAQVYYSNGNHEQRMKENIRIYGDLYQRYKTQLIHSGVIMLENKSYIRDWDSDLASLYGVEIPMKYYEKFEHNKMTKENVIQLIGNPDPNVFQILIAHNPAHYQAYQDWGADLVVSGHLHGGIIRLPFIGGVITPQVQLFPRLSGGIYKRGDTTFVVSRGLGNHTIPIRLFNPAEVVVMHIDGTK